MRDDGVWRGRFWPDFRVIKVELVCFIIVEVESIVACVVVKQVVVLNPFVTCVSSDSYEENWVSSLWSLCEPASKSGEGFSGSYRGANPLILKVMLSAEDAINTCVNCHVCRGRLAAWAVLR